MSQENIHELVARELLNHANFYRILPNAGSDLIRRVLNAQPTITSTGEIRLLGGELLKDFVVNLRDGDGRHLFAPPTPPPAPEAPTVPVPPTRPKLGPGPAAGAAARRTRDNALTETLEKANAAFFKIERGDDA